MCCLAEEAQIGPPRGASGQWASCLRIVDPATLTTISLVELEFNEAAISMCLARFSSAPQLGLVLAVGTVQSLTFYPRESKDGFVRLYQVCARLTYARAGHVASNMAGSRPLHFVI